MNNKLYRVDNEGNLNFGGRKRLLTDKYKPDSVWNHTWVLGVIIVACAISDYATFSSLFASFLYDNALLRTICVTGMILLMEFSPAYLGFNLKRKKCGYNVDNIAIIVPLAAFILGAAINIILRLATHSLVFPDLTNTTTSVIGSGTAESGTSQNSLVYAWFFGILPIATSLLAFGASYTISNPLKSELAKVSKENIEITNQIDQLEAVIAEYESDQNHLDRLLSEDQAKFDSSLSMIHKHRDEYCDYSRQKIAEHLGTAAGVSYAAERFIPNNSEENFN